MGLSRSSSLFLAGCGTEMYDQPRYKPYAASDFFDDGMSARPLVAGTVPRGDARERGQASEELFTTGKTAGKLAAESAFPGGSFGPGTRPGALSDLLHAMPQ